MEISLQRFLSAVRENAARIHGYELGRDGSDGKSDCIGLIIGALGLAGFRWPGTHGSNWAARNAMSTFGHIANAGEMFLGEIVYKAREPGESKYDLPSAYKNSPDQRDYYHVGVVTSVDPLIITHCTSVNGEGGIFQDEKIGKWRWGGQLKYVDYTEGDDRPVYEIRRQEVFAEGNKKPVRMRMQPDKNSKVVAEVPQGEIVDNLTEENGWAFILWDDITGYMMTEFLRPVEEPEKQPDAKIEVALSDLEEAMNQAENLYKILSGMLRGDTK